MTKEATIPQYPPTCRSQLFSWVPIAQATFRKSSALCGKILPPTSCARFAHFGFAAKIVELADQLSVGSSGFFGHAFLREEGL